jgi:hypothetical protein
MGLVLGLGLENDGDNGGGGSNGGGGGSNGGGDGGGVAHMMTKKRISCGCILFRLHRCPNLGSFKRIS